MAQSIPGLPPDGYAAASEADVQQAPPLTEPGLGRRWKKSQRTLQRMRRDGLAPPYFRIGQTVYYRLEDVIAYERARLQRGEDR